MNETPKKGELRAAGQDGGMVAGWPVWYVQEWSGTRWNDYATCYGPHANRRAEAVAAQAARIEALERTLNTIAEMSATQSSGFAGVIRGTALASLRQGQPASEGEA